jgi:hypothetical protein
MQHWRKEYDRKRTKMEQDKIAADLEKKCVCRENPHDCQRTSRLTKVIEQGRPTLVIQRNDRY